ncbi:MAG: acyl-CoA thioesterase II [Propionibacteriaceae bacterium]|jgi:acyl-CoA thioesterase-2|nr:acyl-CoA thioesterase II [Propionibacteriaceae bacterium]
MPRTVDELVELFRLEQTGEHTYLGPRDASRQAFGQRVFGGQVLAQGLLAAYQSIDFDRIAHSLNGYFLRMGDPALPIEYRVNPVRDGGSFSSRRVEAVQRGRTIFMMDASFHRLEPGLSHEDDPPPGVPAPDDCPPLSQVLEQRRRGAASYWDEQFGVVDARFAGDSSGSENANMRVWFRARDLLPGDRRVHQAFLAYASDLTILSVSTVPHQVEFGGPGMQVATINHTMWFHRVARADLWILYDQYSPSASAGLGFSIGRLFAGGQLVASCAQEGMIRLIDPGLLAVALG